MIRQKRTTFTSALAALGLSAAANGQFSFSPGAGYVVGANPATTASGDFNGDAIPDLAVTVDPAGPDSLAILLGNGDGTFTAPFFVILPASSAPEAVVAGDLDGDTDIDLAVGLKDSDPVIAVINGGLANFTLGATAPTGAEPRGMDVADLTGDGMPDLAVANRLGDSVTVLINNGNATFSSTTSASGPEPRDAAFGDFDDDGDQDLAVSCHDDRSVRVYTNAGGAFSPTTTLLVGPNDRPDGVDAGDLNGDGRADIAAATGDDVAAARNTVTVFLASGVLAFTGPAIYVTGPGALTTGDIVLADLDCDGDLDAAAANRDTGNVSALANTGTGVFGPAMLLAAGTSPEHIKAADLDGDGDPGLIATNRDSADITVLINDTCTGIPGDVDGSGAVNVRDLLEMLGAWGDCPQPPAPCPADVDGNGTVGVSDLLILLANWTL